MRLIVSLLAVLALPACGEGASSSERHQDNGRLLLRQYGCGRCHTIPGVADARGNVGPSLAAVSRRVYLAGMLPNTPGNMVRWIMSPQGIDPLTTMPDLGVAEPHARDMVAYLQGLR